MATATGRERVFSDKEVIVTKTDLAGRITYANGVFLRVAGFREEEVIGKPHNIVRHPHMPRCVFKFLWERLRERREVFAYVLNLAKNGDHYWVFAHVTPSVMADGTVVGYHSNRRCVDRRTVEAVIAPLYRSLIEEEERHPNVKAGMAASGNLLKAILGEARKDYDEFIFSL